VFFLHYYVKRSTEKELLDGHLFNLEELTQMKQDDPNLIKQIQLNFLQHPKNPIALEKVKHRFMKI
jgi:hypothetical protein